MRQATRWQKIEQMLRGQDSSPILFVNLALYFTGAVCLYSTGHWIGGTILLGAWVRIATITGI